MLHFRRPPDDHIPISLGYRCEVAYQIRRRFGVHQALPFDWLITPLSSIARMVEEGFSHMADPVCLEPIDLERYGRIEQGVLNTRYNVVMRHDFRETEDLRLLPGWRDEIPDVAAKWAHLARRWEECLTSGKAITFVRRAGNISIVNGDSLPTKASQYHDLFDLLRKRAPRSRFIVADPHCDLNGNDILVGDIGAPSALFGREAADAWKGPSRKWRRLFTKAKRTLATGKEHSIS